MYFLGILPTVQKLTFSPQILLEAFDSIYNEMICSFPSWINPHLSLVGLLFSGSGFRMVMILL